MGSLMSEGSIWLWSKCAGLGMGFWVGEGLIWLRVKAFGDWAWVLGEFEGSFWLKFKLFVVWDGFWGVWARFDGFDLGVQAFRDRASLNA